MPQLKKSAPKAQKKKRMGTEMGKFKAGTLKSSSGAKVTDKKQALAIGLSESGQAKKVAPKQKMPKTTVINDPKSKPRKPANRRNRNKGRS